MATVPALTSEAGFIFQGQVEQLGASGAAGIPASDETAIVRVTQLLKSHGSLSGYTGQLITVILQSPVGLKPGDSAVFFTHGSHYGETLVVRELGNMPPEATMQAQVESATQSEADSKLTQRLAAAQAVVTGTALAPRPLEGANMGTRRVSEHDPQWWVATVNVETSEKGQEPGPTKDVVFANSTDIAWYKSPKVKEGDRGIWLLHNRDPYGKAVPAPAAVDELDFQPIEQLEHVRSLLAVPAPE